MDPNANDSAAHWGRTRVFIANALQLPLVESFEYHDSLLGLVSGSGRQIVANHRHFNTAVAYLKGRVHPASPTEFLEHYHPREWAFVAEFMLLAIRFGLLAPNEFQQFLIKVYCAEHRPYTCCGCGLPAGVWCDGS